MTKREQAKISALTRIIEGDRERMAALRGENEVLSETIALLNDRIATLEAEVERLRGNVPMEGMTSEQVRDAIAEKE